MKPVRVGFYHKLEFEEHTATVGLSKEVVKRYNERKPKAEVFEWLLTEGVKEPLGTLIDLPGTLSLKSVLVAPKSKVSIVVYLHRAADDPKRIRIEVGTVYVGTFYARDIDDYKFEFSHLNPPVKVVFEREYDPALVQAVLSHLHEELPGMRPFAGYHLGDSHIDYIAEHEGAEILIPDSRWMEELYVYEFEVRT